jgi:carboxyl-terminal processing protease
MLRKRVFLTLVVLASASIPAAFGQPIAERRGQPRDDDGWGQKVLDVLGPEHILREAWRQTTRGYFDRSLDVAHFAEVRDRYAARAAAADTPVELHGVINEMLGELHVSHLSLMEGAVWDRELASEFEAKPTLRAGCELVQIDGRLHVDGVSQGGPAEAAGLRDGDEVVTIDGAPALGSAALDSAGHDPGIPGLPGFFFRPPHDAAPFVLGVRRAADGPVEAVTLTPGFTSLVDATRRSAHTVQVEGHTVGVIRLWHFMTMDVARALVEALDGPLASADTLVLDVRGRGGSDMVVRRILSVFTGRRATWTKPVVVLTSHGTRSAKEIFAWSWRRSDRGPIVGERTAGACIGCTFRRLSDGSVLMVPVQDVRALTRGELLEGVGVEPTIPVAQLPLPYRAGRDAILDAGVREAAGLIPSPTKF